MAERAALTEDLGSVPGTHRRTWMMFYEAHNHLPLFWSPQAPGTSMVYIHTCKTDIQTKLSKYGYNKIFNVDKSRSWKLCKKAGRAGWRADN